MPADNGSHVIFSVSKSLIQIPADYSVSLEKVPWIPRHGEIITLQDCLGRHFRGRVFSISGTCCRVHIFEYLPKAMESSLDILLLQALPEKERMEWIIQKSTELGVNSIVPFFSERSTTLEEREKRQRKAHRWPAIAQKAAKQSRRVSAPVVKPYTDFPGALRQAQGYDLKILLWESERECSLDSKFSANPSPSRICLLVGPEGGFTQAEVETAWEEGFIPIGLGPRILRTETAAIAIIAIVQYKWGDLA